MTGQQPRSDTDLLQLKEDDLYALIGDDLAGPQAFPLTQSELIERGQAWFNANLDRLRAVVCPHAKQLTEETEARSALIAVADLLAGVILHVAPVKVAALILKVGVKKLCRLDT
jgi:hypothetical protein